MSDNATQTVNKLRLDLFKIVAGQTFHAAADTPIATADATDLPSLLTLVNALATSVNAHVPNVVDPTAGTGVHGADSGHRVSTSDTPPVQAAADLATARGLLGNIESRLQGHASSKPAHFTAERLTAPYVEMNGGLSEVIAHANALKAQINAHYAAALNAQVAA